MPSRMLPDGRRNDTAHGGIAGGRPLMEPERRGPSPRWEREHATGAFAGEMADRGTAPHLAGTQPPLFTAVAHGECLC